MVTLNTEFDGHIQTCNRLGDADPESRHGLEDELMIQFIKDLPNLSKSERKLRRIQILDLVTEQVRRWYA